MQDANQQLFTEIVRDKVMLSITYKQMTDTDKEKTIFMVAHDLRSILSCCDQVIRPEQGQDRRSITMRSINTNITKRSES